MPGSGATSTECGDWLPFAGVPLARLLCLEVRLTRCPSEGCLGCSTISGADEEVKATYTLFVGGRNEVRRWV